VREPELLTLLHYSLVTFQWWLTQIERVEIVVEATVVIEEVVNDVLELRAVEVNAHPQF
jgi:hypothetical protein